MRPHRDDVVYRALGELFGQQTLRSRERPDFHAAARAAIRNARKIRRRRRVFGMGPKWGRLAV